MIIALCGKKGSGKTLAANFIQQQDKTFKHLAFADTIKDIVIMMYPTWDRSRLDSENILDRIWKESIDGRYNTSPRKAMQDIGKMFKKNDKTVWCRLLKSKITDMNENIVISDVRFPDEVEYIHNEFPDAKIIKLTRGRNSGDDNDISETSVDLIYNCDMQYNNNQSKEDLYQFILKHIL